MRNKILKFSLMTLGVLAGGFVSSCTTDLEPSSGAASGTMLVKAPEVTAYTGDHYWGNNGGTRSLVSTQPYGYYKAQDYPLTENFKEQNPSLYEVMTHAPEAVGEEEWNFVKNYLAEHPDEGYTSCNLTDYFIQWAGKSYDTYYCSDMNNASHSVVGSSQMDYIVIDGQHLRDYNGSWGPIAYCENWPLNSPQYHDSYGNLTVSDEYQFYYIKYNGEWNLYLCFDYTTRKDSGEYVEGDGRHNDWVLKITPADGSKIVPPGEEADDPTEEQICEKTGCEHKQHESNGCSDCYYEGRSNECATMYGQWLLQTGQIPGEGDNDNVAKGLDEVEVNLALDSKKDNLLESHLSIHVRTATDVEVFIPVPAQYYCEADDMAIVIDHAEAFIHGGPYKTEYEIGKNVVSLCVIFDEGGITVRTEGINQDVIDYCWETYKDGITFEIWNYFNDPDTGLPYVDMEALKGYLDRSTVRFLPRNPGKYVNAFGRDNGKYSAETPDGKDFHVVPANEEDFKEPVEGPHQNGSALNDIYKVKT